MNTVPVLFLLFNRPELAYQVFNQIKAYQPSKLYVALDGSRNATEAILVDKVKDLIRVDWKCDVEWKINQENLGCKMAVSSAITWFFEREPEGIILEDDTLPVPTFFTFCQSMLEKYRHDHRVGLISGSNFIKVNSPFSYYFSKYSHCWGWATWASVWKNYEVEIKDFESLPYEIHEDIFERIYWYEKFRDCHSGIINTWDYQLLFMLWKYKKRSILPKNNLVSNIGFNHNATHFTFKNLGMANLTTTPMHCIHHPKTTLPDPQVDKLIFKKVFNRMLPSNIIHLMMHLYRTGIQYPYFQRIYTANR